MPLIEMLIAIGLLQVWGANNPLHKDAWFDLYHKRLAGLPWVRAFDGVELLLLLIFPSIAIFVVSEYLPTVLSVLFSALVLVYSLGRGEFGANLSAYLSSCGRNSWEDATGYARDQGVDCAELDEKNWNQLHEKMLTAASYQGFERLFAVLFWFVLLGPAGALLYRLSFFYRQRQTNDLTKDWLWALEWPAVRALGLSMAVTGNFVGCFNRLKTHIRCFSSATGFILFQSVLGALSVDDEMVHSCDVTQRELALLQRLYMRTLWFWVACVALFTLWRF